MVVFFYHQSTSIYFQNLHCGLVRVSQKIQTLIKWIKSYYKFLISVKMEEIKLPGKFWKTDESGKATIIHSKLVKFLTDSGFAKAELPNGTYVLVKVEENLVEQVEDWVIVDFIKNYLRKIEEDDVLETFSKGISGFVSKAKLRLLETQELINDKDDEDSSWFYFENITWQVSKSGIKGVNYEDLQGKIWKSRILPHSVMMPPLVSGISQFETFCRNLAGKSDDRFKSLKTIIGYLLHRYNNPSNAKAIIFNDENISFDGTANGGTGKSLLMTAIGKCRQMVVMDGKNMKGKSWYKNQRIGLDTDLVFYDDVGKDFNLEELYSMITTGIVVEKKYKDEQYISPENAPKISISSNYVVSGTGGSTDIRRRCEFEVANHYNENYGPEDEFGNQFFNGWDIDEWNRFYVYMTRCVKEYLKNGLIIPRPINLKYNKLVNATSLEFISFMETGTVDLDEWTCKQTILKLFTEEYPHLRFTSSHMFTKWMKRYAIDKELTYDDRKSGKNYEFILISPVEEEAAFENVEYKDSEAIEESTSFSEFIEEKEVSDDE